MKKQVMFALLGLLTLSLLPGCGKSKNDEGVIVGGGPVLTPGVGVTPTGCYDTRSIYGTSITLGFSGSLQGSVGGIRGQLGLSPTGLPGGYTNTYWRQTVYGDRTDIAVSGSSAYAQVTVSSSAIALANQYGGQICGFYMDVSVLNPAVTGSAWSGNVGGGTFGILIPYGSSYGVIQL
jgi:hypothetical protein